MWQIEISHPGLNKYRHIRGKDKSVVEQKAAAQQAAWAEMWLIKLEKEQQSLIKQLNHEQAKLRTLEAVKAVEELKNILQHTLGVDDTIEWETLKSKKAFHKQRPNPPQPQEIPQAPTENAPQYHPKLGILDKLISSRRENKTKRAQELYETDCQRWKKQKEEILRKNAESEKKYLKQLQLWQAEEQEFLAKQKETNEAIEKRKEQYLGKDPGAYPEFCVNGVWVNG